MIVYLKIKKSGSGRLFYTGFTMRWPADHKSLME